MSSLNSRSPVGECRVDICGYRNDFSGNRVDQATEKRRRFFGRSRRDLRINMLRDLFNGEKDWKDHADVVPGSRKTTSWTVISKM